MKNRYPLPGQKWKLTYDGRVFTVAKFKSGYQENDPDAQLGHKVIFAEHGHYGYEWDYKEVFPRAYKYQNEN